MDIKLLYKLSPNYIAFLQFIFHSYDNLVVFSTINSTEGIIQLITDSKNISEVENIIDDLSKNIIIVKL